jgi:hypothetical protein
VIFRQVIVLLYIWWSERCAIRNGSNSHGIGFGYHIWIWIRIQIQILLNTNTKQMSRIRISIQIFTRFNSKCILLNSTHMNKILLPVHH